MIEVNATHDPALRSWVGSANRADTDFPIQNLPFGVFRRSGRTENWRAGVAIGDQVLDLGAPALGELPTGLAAKALAACASEPALNSFMAMGRDAWSAMRGFLSEVLRSGSPHAERLGAALVASRTPLSRRHEVSTTSWKWGFSSAEATRSAVVYPWMRLPTMSLASAC
jgi:fumarylacetoacetase